MISKRSLLLLAASFAVSMLAFAAEDKPFLRPYSQGRESAERMAVVVADDRPFPRQIFREPAKELQRVLVRPLFDTPMRHVSVARAEDGNYYLTGTLSKDGKGEDFQNNDGIFLWKSPDLKIWEPLGQVWSIGKDAPKSPASAWQLERRVNPDSPDGPLARGMTAPELHRIGDGWFVTYSMNGQGTGLLKSESGKPEGPHRDLGRITPDGGSPSMFQDKDGAVYWLWGSGWIARMKDDLTGLADAPRRILTGHETVAKYDKGHKHQMNFSPVRPEGFFMSRNPKGELIVYFSASNERLGGLTRDTLGMVAETPYGPYGVPLLTHEKPTAIEHGGEVTVFQGADRAYATFYGADRHSIHQDRPALVPLGADWKSNSLGWGFSPVHTQRGPWDVLEPAVKGLWVNDCQMLNAPDGYYYLTGSVWSEPEKFTTRIWRSKDLRNWEEWELFSWDIMPGMKPVIERFRQNPKDPGFKGFAGMSMDTEIFNFKGTYWVKIELYDWGDKNKFPGMDRDVVTDQGVLLRSTTGEALGPYEFHAYIGGYGAHSYFADGDGSVYWLGGADTIRKMSPDMKSYDAEWAKQYGQYRIHTREGLKFNDDIGIHPVLINGKIVLFNTNGGNQSRMAYFSADSITGPYERPGLASSRAGHGWVIPSKHRPDIYYQVSWREARTFGGEPHLIPLKYEKVNGHPAFRSIYDMQDDEARKYQDEIDRLLGSGKWPRPAHTEQ
jgi:hypothetical protein